MGYYFGRKDGLFLNIKQNFAIVTAGVLLVSSGITTLPENNFSTCILRAAAEDTATSGSCGTKDSNLTWELDEAGTLTIRGDGMMADWSEKSAPWYPIRDEITSVVIEDGVSHIGTYAFQNCCKLKSVVVPEKTRFIDELAFDVGGWTLEHIYILNPECEIMMRDKTLGWTGVNGTVIHGFEGSTAQVYAEKYSGAFEVIE